MYSLHSFGGKFSLGTPLLSIPDFYLTRPDKTLLGEEEPKNPHLFSNEETSFLIARELGYIAHNHSVLRLAIKVTFFASGILALFGPLGVLCKFLISGISLGCLIWEERTFQQQMDKIGVEILAQTYPDKSIQRAAQVAINTLTKIQDLNKESRRENRKLRWFISARGDNWLDITMPPLTQRVQALEKLR